MLFDSKGRRYLVLLETGGEFHTHAGTVPHDTILGQQEGTIVRSSLGARYIAVRPTLAEIVLKMPRGAQVIYPKDLGQILVMADISPGPRVLEAGLGSGALSMALLAGRRRHRRLRATGRLRQARRSQRDRLPGRRRARAVPRGGARRLRRASPRKGLDRVLLDLPEPWRVVKHAAGAMRPGGIIVSYLPTVGQVMTLREALADAGFGMAETVEVLLRPWHVDGQSVRPEHRMVGHTGFLTAARLMALAP